MQLSFNPKTDLKQAFATPIGLFQLPNAGDLAPKIANVVLAREKKDAGVVRSNFGGWHSDDDLLRWPELQFADIADTCRSAVSHMIAVTSGEKKFNTKLAISAWANINRAGTSNNCHMHPDNHWSGVIYIKTPDLSADPIEKAGFIEFQDPRGAVGMMQSPGQTNILSIPPHEGMILVFPSWMYHWVNSFSVEATRISLAFNAKISSFEPIKSA